MNKLQTLIFSSSTRLFGLACTADLYVRTSCFCRPIVQSKNLVFRCWINQKDLTVRRHNSKFEANCALFDTSMKFGTLIVDTKTSIFRYSAKPELGRFPWKPQFINIHGFLCLFLCVLSFQWY